MTGPVSDGTTDEPLARLLDLQDVDTTIDQLRHRRVHDPARAALAAVQARRAETAGRADELRGVRDQLAAGQADLERQIEAARQRRQQLDQRMRSGQVTAARDLSAMDEEVRHLGAHISGLEDRELEVMEALEPVEADLQSLVASLAQADEEAADHRQALATLEQELDAAIAEAEARRQVLAGAVPEALLAQYERIRARAGGVGAARLVGARCTGCHLELPSMEVDRIRKAPPGTVVTCDQCGRILVR